MKFDRPTELADHLTFIEAFAPDFPPDTHTTVPQAFADACETLEHFIAHTPTAGGKELLQQCIRNLHVAYEYYEDGDETTGGKTVMETEEMFRRCRKYISLSDE